MTEYTEHLHCVNIFILRMGERKPKANLSRNLRSMKFMRRAESAIDLDAEVKNAFSAKRLLFSFLGC